MDLLSLSIANYKSFLEMQTAAIGPGFNLFIGANNSGKTTMLEAVDLDSAKSSPHRSIWSLPNHGDQIRGQSILKMSFHTDVNELRSLVGELVMIPIPANFSDKLTPPQAGPAGAVRLIEENPSITINLELGSNLIRFSVLSAFGESEMAELPNAQVHTLFLQYTDTNSNIANGSIVITSASNMPLRFDMIFKKFFYRFAAQRRSSGESQSTGLPVLLYPDASNLAYCIGQLQLNDAHGHEILCEWVNRVFPSVQWIQAPLLENGVFQLQCLPRPKGERRDDLAVPLSQMGTGIGNVIAILYIVLAHRQPRIIAIDEPNSFLHPKALRELLQILSVEGIRHQYILTGHSADVMTAIKPTLVTMFSAIEGRTTVRQVGTAGIADLRADLSDLGIRMTDLHGRDRVLWVEGQTEEIVIPELLRYFCPTAAAGTAVLRVEHTGTFEKKKGISASEVAAIYKRLSQSSALVPPMVGILLDREGKTAAECATIERESAGTLRFLDRTMLEDYVLDADAIASILSELGENCSHQEVADILAASGSDETAATKLENIFNSVSNARHTFRKTRDTPSIVTWLLTNKPTYLQPLGMLLASIVDMQAVSPLTADRATNA